MPKSTDKTKLLDTQPGDLIISDQYWGPEHATQLKLVLESVIEVFAAIDVVVQDSIKVSYKQYPHSPKTLYRKGSKGEHLILVGVSGRKWNQLVYQFAHEFFHVYTDHSNVKGKHKFRWVEEIFCQVASIVALERLSNLWSAESASPAKNQYAPYFSSYAEKTLQGYGKPLSAAEFCTWFSENESSLQKNPDDISSTGVAAIQLHELVRANPGLLSAAQPVNRISSQSTTLESYVSNWAIEASEYDKPLISKFYQLFTGYSPTNTLT